MDSGNSGSLQSSSGGEEEYNSRAVDSIFITAATPPPPHLGPISHPQPPPLFDPLSNYIQQLHQNPNPNMPWPRDNNNPLVRSTTHDIINPMRSASPTFIPAFQPPPTADNNNLAAAQSPNQSAARNPKKRSRASRRAPTTVLTTDTTNFRAMVQEFTGIPAPPFNSTPSFPRTRLDLFGTRSAALDAPPPPPYLRRPFAQKVQSPPPFLGSTSSLLSSAAIAAASSAANNINNNIPSISSASSAASTSTTPINYQIQISQSPNLFNIPNPLVNSIIQTNPKFIFSNSNSSSVMASKPSFNEIPSNHDMKIGGFDDFGLGHENHVTSTLGGLPNLISSDQVVAAVVARTDRNENKGVGPDDEGGDYRAQMRVVNGGYDMSRSAAAAANGKVNYTAASSSSISHHGQKVISENIINAATRGEGMVESWICSSSE